MTINKCLTDNNYTDYVSNQEYTETKTPTLFPIVDLRYNDDANFVITDVQHIEPTTPTYVFNVEQSASAGGVILYFNDITNTYYSTMDNDIYSSTNGTDWTIEYTGFTYDTTNFHTDSSGNTYLGTSGQILSNRSGVWNIISTGLVDCGYIYILNDGRISYVTSGLDNKKMYISDDGGSTFPNSTADFGIPTPRQIIQNSNNDCFVIASRSALIYLFIIFLKIIVVKIIKILKNLNITILEQIKHISVISLKLNVYLYLQSNISDFIKIK
jgi:hypothetical protein